LPGKHLIQLLDNWRTKRITVVGDFMADRYVYGHAQRLSPDAPVPILAAQRQELKPGGAANVALALRALRCHVHCLGVVGNDSMANALRDSLKTSGCDPSGLITDKDRPTTVKHNFIGLAQHRHPQKMFRVDEESNAPISKNIAERLLKLAEHKLKKSDILCLEDYGKGVLTESICQDLIKLAKRMNIPVLVDPAATDDYTKYRGATCITPNRFEAALATNRDADNADNASLIDMGRKLIRDLRLESLVLTLDRQGLLLMRKGEKPSFVPTRAREVYDVTGAGDTVLAMLAAALANNTGWERATQLANVAAGLEVERFGAIPVDLDEILLDVFVSNHGIHGKLRTLEELIPELQAHKRQGKTIAFTNGCFDILHAGHVSYLRAAADQGDLLVVALNSDKSIRKLKGNDRPVNNESDRVMVLSALESIDYVVVFSQDTPKTLLKKLKPDVLVKGDEYTHNQIVGHEIVESYGGKIARVPMVKGKSTTNIIRKIGNDSPKK
jgi:D-beta-D-heptose 7-phosphate kinase / D-beta-D-heptose 1-phosphate adenosyltransferase